MDRARIFTEIAQRNAARKAALLPLLNMRVEFDHACALAQFEDWLAFRATKQADFDRIKTEVQAELTAKMGQKFPQNMLDRLALNRLTEQRFETHVAIHYGVIKPRFDPRHEIVYGQN